MRAVLLSIVAAVLLAPGSATAQDPLSTDPLGRGRAQLLQIETLAMEAKRRTVADLALEDFLLTIDGRAVPIETFDRHCPIGAADDPLVHKKDDPAPTPISPATARKIVLAVDYNSLAVLDRRAVLEAIESMLIMSKTPAEEVMLVALADGARIEQRFTTSLREIVSSLRRMRHDVTLSARAFGDEALGKSYFDSLASVLDLLSTEEGAKVVVLFSTLLTKRDPDDRWFADLASRATAARTAIYPDWARGLELSTQRHGAPTLQRFAAETGGRPPVATSDLSLQYRRAQRDLSCRYVLGVRLADMAATTTKPLRVRVGRSGVILLYPGQVRSWTEEERERSRVRVAFVDPEANENPLVRGAAFPLRPVDRSWDTLLAVQFPTRPGTEEATLQLSLSVESRGRQVERHRTPVRVAATETGRSGPRLVTATAESSLKPGSYDLKVDLSRDGGDAGTSHTIRFEIPEIPKKGLFVRGPILARRGSGGVLVRADRVEAARDTALDRFLGGDSGFEPMLVNRIGDSSRFLAYWEACLAGSKDVPPAGSVVRRRFVTLDGVEAHALSPVPFAIGPKGQMRCVHALDEITPRTLRPGEYRLEVSLEKPGGENLARGSAPLKTD